jgi:hypothetical protein
VAQKKDQVFQLSLTEVAFIITFLLLMLLGYVVVKEQREKEVAQAALHRVQSTEQATNALRSAKAELAKALEAGGSANPDDVISAMVRVDAVRADRDRLQQRVDELDAKLTSLTKLEELLAKAAPQDRELITQQQINEALALREQIRKIVSLGSDQKHEQQNSDTKTKRAPQSGSQPSTQMSQGPVSTTSLIAAVKDAVTTAKALKRQLRETMSTELTTSNQEDQIRTLINDANAYVKVASSKAIHGGDVIKENTDLRGQVAFLKHRLDARGGRDFPPCWADEEGKVEFLFAVETKSGTVEITPAWPTRREGDAMALPGIAEALNGPHSHQDFPARVKKIFASGKRQPVECRHYVQLKSSIVNAVDSDRARLMIENFFYKTEVRR